MHADHAAVNLNFWVTPDEANLDPSSGGLVVYPKAPPADAEVPGDPSRKKVWISGGRVTSPWGFWGILMEYSQHYFGVWVQDKGVVWHRYWEGAGAAEIDNFQIKQRTV